MPTIPYINAQQLTSLLPWNNLIDALQDVFLQDVIEPVRHHHFLNVPDEPQATLLLMPAWIEGQYLGVKQVSVFPGNNARNQPAINGSYLLSNANTGEPLLQLDANELTARRTAAASALASKYLSRDNASQLLMIGAGRMARALIEVHSIVRPIETIQIWSRTEKSALKLVKELQAQGKSASLCKNQQLPQAVADADIISCATVSTQPIVLGKWLQSGVHLDLVGAFRQDMRETDDEAISRSSVFVDTRAGALSEAGDLTQPIDKGLFSEGQVIAELKELCAGKHSGRSQLTDSNLKNTLFKSVGAAREDLAAAMLAHKLYEKTK